MTDKQVTCYTCRFCKIHSHGDIYCSLREKGGKCYAYDSWESQEDVLDKLRAEIEQEYKDESEHPYGHGLRRAIEIIDKYKGEGEDICQN